MAYQLKFTEKLEQLEFLKPIDNLLSELDS